MKLLNCHIVRTSGSRILQIRHFLLKNEVKKDNEDQEKLNVVLIMTFKRMYYNFFVEHFINKAVFLVNSTGPIRRDFAE